MKKTIRKHLAAAACIGALFFGVMPVMAASETGTVTFDGTKITTDYSMGSVAEAFSDLVPGDKATYTVTLKNASQTGADWYVKNDVVKSFEDDTNAANGAYTFKLEYISPNNTKTTIYSSNLVGGDKTANTLEGLHQTEGSTGQYYYLGNVGAGKSGKFRITVGLDGESQTNTYMNTLADLKVEFAVEPRNASRTAGGTNETAYGDGYGYSYGYGYGYGYGNGTGVLVPKTGDPNRFMIPAAAILTAGALLVLLFYLKGRQKR